MLPLDASVLDFKLLTAKGHHVVDIRPTAAGFVVVVRGERAAKAFRLRHPRYRGLSVLVEVAPILPLSFFGRLVDTGPAGLAPITRIDVRAGIFHLVARRSDKKWLGVLEVFPSAEGGSTLNAIHLPRADGPRGMLRSAERWARAYVKQARQSTKAPST